MKPRRAFGPLPHIRYRPELTHCPHCGTRLVVSHPVWRKPIQSLRGIEHVTSLGFRCANPACAFPRTVYRSARAEARQVRNSGYGLDVVAHIGHWRFGQHRTREEIWRHLEAETPVRISERHVQNLLEVYLALLRASHRDLPGRLRAIVAEHGGLIVALDGLQVLGVVSDAQECVRVAVANTFPGVPHQLCHYHALHEAAEPLWEADRHLLVEAKMELRPLRDVEERTRRPAAAEPTDPAGAVVLDAVLALRQTVRERGKLPFDFAGLRALEALHDLGQTLDRCLRKKGTVGWPGCGA